MTISFTPALGEIVRIPVTADAVSVRLRFTAVLLVRDYRYYERNGAKLQIWSDIPNTNEMDGWKAFDFEDPRDGEELEQDYDQVILPFVVNAPVKPGTKFFSFTYRILYPTGEVRWLGVPDRNGAFIVRRQKTREKAEFLSPPERVEPVSPPLQEQNQEADVPSPRGTLSHALLPGSMGIPSTNDSEPDIRPLRLRQRKVAPTPTFSMLNSDVVPTFTVAGPSVDTRLVMPGGLLECDVQGDESTFGEQDPRDLPISPSVDPEEILRFWRDDFVLHRPPPNPPSATQPPSSTLPHIPDSIESRILRSTPLTVWGWVLDESVYVPGSLPLCRTLSDRYERFHKAIKTAKVGEAARFKGFVSLDDSRNPVSQFCFHFASNRNEKDMRRRLTRTEIARLMEAAGTSRQPTWIEIPGSESPQYLPVAAPLRSYLYDSDVDV